MFLTSEHETLTPLLDAVAERDPDALAALERTATGTRTLTYAELRDRGRLAAGALAERGVAREDVVAVWLPNRVEQLVLEYAAAALGAAIVGVSTRYGPHDLAHVLRTARPAGVVAPGRFLGLDLAERLRVATAAAGVAPWVLVVGEPAAFGAAAEAFDAALAAASPRAPAGRPDDVLNYFTTSGSTSQPKLAGHDQRAVTRHARNVARALDLRPGDVFLGALPLSGVFGFNPALAALAAGATTLLEPVFDPDAALADMARFGVTHAIGGDDLLGRIMDAWERAPVALPAFRRGGVADFQGRARAVAAWAQREHGAAISGLYGSSELFALTAIWPPGLPLDDRVRPGGRVVSDAIEVRVADPETGAPCAPGEIGELQFRGYVVLTGYRGASGPALAPGGWLRSSDLGSLTGRPGELVYACRAGDALRLRGFLVEPAEIEAYLMSHPQVHTAKVVGVRDAEGAERAVAYATLRPPATATAPDLVAHCRRGLAAFKVPSAIRVIDEFPTTMGPNGAKIRTAELRRRAQAQL